jgi:hypothetical protein
MILLFLQGVTDQAQSNPALTGGAIIAAVTGLIGSIVWLIRTLGRSYGEAKLQIWRDEAEARLKAQQYERDRVAFREDKYFDVLTGHLADLDERQDNIQKELTRMSLFINQLQNTMRLQNEILSEIHEFLRSTSARWSND